MSVETITAKIAGTVMGTTAQWAASTRILLAGEKGRDTTLGREKTGDGTSLFDDLEWDDQAVRDLIPTDLADLAQDATHRTVTDAEKATWNAGSGLALGETSTTAYRGDRGKAAYDHSQVTGNPHGTTKEDLGVVTYHPITLGIDNGDTVIPTGTTAQVVAPYAGTITGWRILGTPAATVEVDVRKKAGAVPSSADTIVASDPPALTAASVASSTALTGWTTAVAAGDVLVMSVTANNLTTRITLVLEVVA